MLLTEEQMVVGWLSDYGVLKWDQLVQMLHTKPAQVATKILAGLKKRNVIVQNEEGFVALDQYAKTDQRLIKAMWVMLQYIEQIEPAAHYPAAYPSSIFFLKDGVGYEVLVLSRGEEHLPRLLRPMDNTKFIIILPDIEMAGSLALPEAPCMFATVSEANDSEVTFYEMEDDEP